MKCSLFSEEHEIFRGQIRKFVEREIIPNVDKWEEEKYFPDELFIKAGEAGLLGVIVPEEYGGSGGDAVHAAVLIEELVRSGSGGVQAYNIMMGFDFERLVMAIGAVMGAEYALHEGMKYAKDRTAFGRPISKFQVWKHKFAHYATMIEAAKQLTYHGLCLYKEGENAIKELTMAKYLATEVSNRVTDMVLQVHGGYGYAMDFPVQRWWRDSRIGTIGGGTSEIMLEIISKMLGL